MCTKHRKSHKMNTIPIPNPLYMPYLMTAAAAAVAVAKYP